jgi:chemotaxis protein methyltransferase CheR
VTTRETLFFRDNSPFQALENKAVPEIIDAKAGTLYAKRLRIWSAACSSGQEPYSIAITLMEMLPNPLDWDIQILGTDLSDAALASASLGFYTEFEIGRGMRPELLDRYFTPEANGWRIKDEVRSLVSFSRRNLLEPFTMLGPFDVIFCRNVAIYFDLPVKRDLFERLAGVTTPDGCIFVGSSENLSDYGPRWSPQLHCRTVFYQPNRARTSFSLQPEVGAAVLN